MNIPSLLKNRPNIKEEKYQTRLFKRFIGVLRENQGSKTRKQIV